MRTGLILVCLVFSVCWGKPDPNSLEAEAVEVEKMVKELPVKEKALKIKEYTGTIDVIMVQRVVDVNEVLVYAKEMTVKAKSVCEKMDMKVKKKDFIKAVIDRHGKVKDKEKQKHNSEFLGAVVEIVNDPNNTLPVDDPNYVTHAERMNDFFAACVEISTPK